MNQSSPTPERIFEALWGHQRTAALKAGVDLELFTAIHEGNRTPKILAKRCQASERGMRMLADYLTMLGLLNKTKEEYFLNPDSEMFLVKDAPTYVGGAMEFMLAAPLYDGFRRLTEAVRKGGTALDEKGTTAEEHPEWVTFAKAMIPMMIAPARWIGDYLVSQSVSVEKVLDIAAGHGIFGIEIAKQYPHAQIVAVDWANVLTVAKEQAQNAGVSDRYLTIPGNAFSVEYGKGYDLVLLTNFLHHFDVPTCEDLLKKVYASVNDGGKVITVEFVPNDDRITPESADFALVMLVTTPSGDAYTFKELDAMFRNAGFGSSEIHAVPGSKEHVIVTHKGS